jgi:hypothetical protein
MAMPLLLWATADSYVPAGPEKYFMYLPVAKPQRFWIPKLWKKTQQTSIFPLKTKSCMCPHFLRTR